MVLVKVKWGKEIFQVEVDLSAPVAVFKAQVQSLSGVPATKQVITGVKGGQLKDDANLAEVGIVPGKALMMIGTAEEIPQAPDQPVQFAEDSKQQNPDSLTSNGLQNLGNTCYMNSGIQALRQIPELRQILPESTHLVEKQLYNLLKSLDTTKNALAPMQFWQALMVSFPTFAQTDNQGRPMQQDAQEALSSILQLVNQTIATKQNLGQFSQLFQGMYEQTDKCVEATDETTTRNVSFNILPCNVSNEVETLENGLEVAMADIFQAESASLKREAQFQRKSKLAKLPEYLFVTFLRFTWRGDSKQKAKVLKPVSFPMVVDVYTLCTDELKKALDPQRVIMKRKRDEFFEKRKKAKEKTHFDEHEESDAKKESGEVPVKTEEELAAEEQLKVIGNTTAYYELSGVISHKGRDADGGHYVSWIKRKQIWLVFDDENVGQVSEEDIRRLRGVGEAHIAYVLMYRTRDPDTGEFPILI